MCRSIGSCWGSRFFTGGSNFTGGSDNSFEELKTLLSHAPHNMADVTISTDNGPNNVTYEQYLELSKQVIDQAPFRIELIKLDKEGKMGLNPDDFKTVIDIAIKKSGQSQKEELIKHIKYSGYRYTPEDKDHLVAYIDTCLQRPTHQSVSSGIASDGDDGCLCTCSLGVDILHLGSSCIDLITKNS